MAKEWNDIADTQVPAIIGVQKKPRRKFKKSGIYSLHEKNNHNDNTESNAVVELSLPASDILSVLSFI
jgi:hypothetical protein